MTIDFSKIKRTSAPARPIDPIAIFQSCKVSDESINDLWLAQGDALREYHNHRDASDITIALNTGAGKTLVGLLIAQSLANESSQQVVYACASIQLIEQTKDKANGYGLDVTTYYQGQFSDDGYNSSARPCLTTYQALFNGKTRFQQDDIGAIIFDDAHTADQILRDQFTLSIDRERLQLVYDEISSLFADYHAKTDRRASYEEMLKGDSHRTFWIPPNEIYEKRNRLSSILLESSLSDNVDTMFSWEHLRDFTDRCCVLISNQSITITPPFIPIGTLPYFSTHVRRVYLSATLDARDSFARTFGRVPVRRIAPSTKAGECERLVLVPSMSPHISDEQESLKTTASFLSNRKALIIVPTYDRSDNWLGVAERPDKDSVAARVREFRSANTTKSLTLVGRYDGIDLPDDKCRVLVIDGLPKGTGPLERYLWEYLQMENALRNPIACRLVQAFGRISRGMSDYGVIILSGDELVRWLRIPRNLKLLPKFLARQIKLGFDLSEQIDENGLEDPANYCLQRNPDWIGKHGEFVSGDEEDSIKDSPTDLDAMVKVALAECRYIEFLWDADFGHAARALRDVSEDAGKVSDNLKAWHEIWLGYALERAGDREGAQSHYRNAHAIQRNIPRFPWPDRLSDDDTPGQVRRVVEQMDVLGGTQIGLPKRFKENLAALRDGSSNQMEESLRYLGQYLGFESSRPDNEYGTGPDVLWTMKDVPLVVCIEAKTDKGESSKYNKRDIGQMHDHVQWLHDNGKAVGEVVPIFVGPKQIAAASANPSDDMLVAESRSFRSLASKLESVLRDAAERALPISLAADVKDAMQEASLLGRDVLALLEIVRVKDGRSFQ